MFELLIQDWQRYQAARRKRRRRIGLIGGCAIIVAIGWLTWPWVVDIPVVVVILILVSAVIFGVAVVVGRGSRDPDRRQP